MQGNCHSLDAFLRQTEDIFAPDRGICHTDIPAWSIGIQYADSTIVHYSGDGIFDGGWAPGGRELLDELFAALPLE